MVLPAESTRSPDDDAAHAVPLPGPDVEALVSSAGRAIDRLQALAVAVRALASDAKARLDALPDENDDDRPETVKARASLRVLARVARGRLRDTLDALQDARAAADAALVAHHRRRQGDEAAAREATEEVARAAATLAAILEEAEEDGLFAPVPELPGAGVQNEVERIPRGDGDGDGDGDEERRRCVSSASRSRGASSRVCLSPGVSDADEIGAAETAALDDFGPGARAAPVDVLRDVIRALRAEERDVDARARLAAEIRSLGSSANGVDVDSSSASANDVRSSSASAYTEENFAYGSTPFGSWLRVISACPELASTMRELADEAGRDAGKSPGYAVWGSSSGWLVFYAALSLGVPSVGYEILKCHVDAARRVAAANDVSEDLASFALGDATEAPLDGVRVVVLTSQCWDEALKTRVARRLAEDLAPGALAVDYGARLAGEAAFGEPIATVTAPSSWNAQQKFFVFRRRA